MLPVRFVIISYFLLTVVSCTQEPCDRDISKALFEYLNETKSSEFYWPYRDSLSQRIVRYEKMKVVVGNLFCELSDELVDKVLSEHFSEYKTLDFSRENELNVEFIKYLDDNSWIKVISGDTLLQWKSIRYSEKWFDYYGIIEFSAPIWLEVDESEFCLAGIKKGRRYILYLFLISEECNLKLMERHLYSDGRLYPWK